MMFTACEQSPDLPSNDVRIRYLEMNLPQLKNLRDQIAFQIKTCKSNIDHLGDVRGSFNQEASIKMVDVKIQAIRQQQLQLNQQLQRIDTEAERGIALKEFNTIDGGGERRKEIDALTAESQQRVAMAIKMNETIDGMYNGQQSALVAEPVDVRKKVITSLSQYPHLVELPRVDSDRLDRAFQEHPEMFDVNNRAGRDFIALVRQLKINDPHYFNNLRWIDKAVQTCVY